MQTKRLRGPDQLRVGQAVFPSGRSINGGWIVVADHRVTGEKTILDVFASRAEAERRAPAFAACEDYTNPRAERMAGA